MQLTTLALLGGLWWLARKRKAHQSDPLMYYYNLLDGSASKPSDAKRGIAKRVVPLLHRGFSPRQLFEVLQGTFDCDGRPSYPDVTRHDALRWHRNYHSNKERFS